MQNARRRRPAGRAELRPRTTMHAGSRAGAPLPASTLSRTRFLIARSKALRYKQWTARCDSPEFRTRTQCPVSGDAALPKRERLLDFPRIRSMRRGIVAVVAAVLAVTSARVRAEPQDPEPAVLSIDSVRVVEGDSATTPAVFTLRVSRQLHIGDAFVRYTTESRSAESGSDFVPTSGTIFLEPGQSEWTLTVPVIGDSLVEGNEQFLVRLTAAEGVTIADSLGLCTIVNDERARFTRTTANLTLDRLPGQLPTSWGDADGDGDPDVTTDFNGSPGHFFAIETILSALNPGDHHGSAWCDYDRDGDADMVDVPYSNDDVNRPVRMNLFRNQGGGTFEDVAPALGMNILGNGETAVWGDFNGDGWPDLFVPFYTYLRPFQCFLWMNDHDGTFTERAAEAGIAMSDVPESLKPEGADAVDWDGNGTLDLYCASHLFLNDGSGHFTDVRDQVGLPQVFDEGAKFVDVDNDGDLDFYLRGISGPRLFRNDNGHYTEVTAQAGWTNDYAFAEGDSWADVDNDGDLDLFYANEPNAAELWLNQGDGTFVSDSTFKAADLDEGMSAWADADQDGDMDAMVGVWFRSLLVNHVGEKPKGCRSLRVWVLDADSMLVCFGATARLREIGGGPGTIQTRVVDGGSCYLTQSEYALHFGGLTPGRHYSLEVRYPGAAGAPTVIDGSVAPLLANFTTDDVPYPDLFVFRDGRVKSQPRKGPPVLAVPFAPVRSATLAPPVPSPALDATTFAIHTTDGRATLAMFDVSGRRVRTLLDDVRVQGSVRPRWDLRDDSGRRVPSGVYLARLVVDGQPQSERRIVVMH